QLFEQLQAPGYQFWAKKSGPRYVSPWPRQARNKFILNRIGHAYCYNWDRGSGLLDRAGGRRSEGNNGINLAVGQFLRQPPEVVCIAIREFPVEGNILSFGVTKLPQPRYERVDSCKTCIGFVAAAE